LCLFVAVGSAFAIDLFSFSVGANISYINPQNNTDSQETSADTKTGFSKLGLDNLSIGIETRMNISNLQFMAVGELTTPNSNTLLASGIITAGLTFDLFSVFRVGASMGPKISYAYFKNSTTSTASEESGVDMEKISNGKNFLDAITTGSFNLRFNFDIIAGPVLTIGVAYVVPTNFTIDEANYSDLFPIEEVWKNGQVSLCVQMALF